MVYAQNSTSYALALHGAPKYAADFKHFDYVNPNAAKGGNITLGVTGSFDSLNPFILKGVAVSGNNLTYETLMEKSLDEPLTSYGLLADTITLPEDRSWVSFHLRPEGKWHDGAPITAEDVVWSFKTLMKDGHPFYRSYYAAVKDVQAINAHEVKFTFSTSNNRELPLIVGDLPVLPKHYWTAKGRDFSKTTLTPPLGSGPYKIKAVDNGRRIVYERVKDWWAAKLPINHGRYNFDTVTFDYYRDDTVSLQAFLAGTIDLRYEVSAKNWAQSYDHPAVKSGQIKKVELKNGLPTGMQGFVYNTRRKQFQDARVREALDYAFDFEWSNKQLAYGAYKRSDSYFSNSDLAASMPIGEAEKALLDPFKEQIPSRVFTEVYHPAKTAGNGDLRQNLRKALTLLGEAGWMSQSGVLKNKDGEAFTFVFLVNTPIFDRWLLPFIANLKKLGIEATIQQSDTAQYINRLNDFDFDVTIQTIPQSLTPGNEQYGYWSSESADTKGSLNLIGVKNPAVDALIGNIVKAMTRDELITATRALDRVLQWNFYVIPQWHIDISRLAYWAKLAKPENDPPYGLAYLDTWWVKQ